ncbi:peptidylprolyl isomerase [Shewanella sp. SNU WT4]|uniref:FKBP-type peptidyl-prolyl cis-trans isomerase n=1 Tax=Shewanella sp. SNU WT4 TaxID=2590015 RepID=UPI00112B1D02|nr:peptidylprolyl isomerase [Shewanella sp. SNU WT4]QDF67750.1 peptidylprolyl isomerase [Shewanella sp. SNU WT4]
MIQAHKVVTIDYLVVDENEHLVDSSEGREPLTYLHGVGNIIRGLEQAIEGKKAGDSFLVTVSPEDGYGEYNPSNVQQVPVEAFGSVEKVEVGMSFSAQGPDGDIPVTITAINDNEATVDANHPLAGKTLTFSGTIRDVRDASMEEISRGHVH